MDWAILAPVLGTLGATLLRFVWMEGHTHQKIQDLCKDTDDIRDELRDLRADLQMNQYERSLSSQRTMRNARRRH